MKRRPINHREELRKKTAGVIWRVPYDQRPAVIAAWREADRVLANAADPEAGDLDALAAGFERDMAPVRDAIVEALEAGDLEALRGLRAMIPGLLEDVNKSPELADLLAAQLGKAVLAGIKGEDR
jgi:hypothetical protein